MPTVFLNPNNLKGQAYVEWLSAETLRQVRVTHRENLSYVTVDLRNQANAEASATREYHGRYLFELLQNANDAVVAARDDPRWSKASDYRVRIDLTDSALIVANDGVPFLESDVDSIYRWGESSKDPNKSIGYKGIGFKSVLEITESPEIFSQIVQFRFDRETCHRTVREIVGPDTDLRLPVTRFAFPYMVDQVQPSSDAELVRRLLLEESFATVIRLPLRVESEDVLTRIEKDLDPALLLFLNGIDEIEVWVEGACQRSLCRRVREPNSDHLGRDITLFEGKKPVSRWLLFDAPKHKVGDRAIIDELRDKAWERVQKVGFAVAFRLDRRGKLRVEAAESTKLFVYFPTAMDTGLRYRIHGDFYIDAARKQVGERGYNEWLAQQIGSFMSSTVVPELIELFPKDERVVQVLVPCVEVSDFAATLNDAILEELRECAFVPDIGGRYRRPSGIMLAPDGASVDLASFHRFFPPNTLTRSHDYRRFPAPEIEQDTQAAGFLVRLGAIRLDFSNAFRLFDGRDLVGRSEDYPALYCFLWEWREQVNPEQREYLSSALGRSRCVIVDDSSWIAPYDRLYHAKLRQETPTMPQAVRADVVHPLAYDPEGRAGPTHKLLSTLSPSIRDYDAPDIIVNAIVPLFEEGRFPRLPLEKRAEVYRYLYGYWQARRGTGDPDVERVKEMVQVPARLISNRRRDEWRQASQVYLSGAWSGDDRLEKLYSGFEDITFLYEVRGLDIPPEERGSWARFWMWLGVAVAPRFLVDEVPSSSLRRGRWRSIQRNHPHGGTSLWLDYLRWTEDRYTCCEYHGVGYRQLRRSVALESLAELIEDRRVDRLILFYDLLAENWALLKHSGIPTAEVYCYRSYCPKYSRSEEVLSFFEFLLREADWIPAQIYIDGKVEYQLYKPEHCWFVSAAESPLVRNLLPAPPAKYTKLEYRQFCRDIGMRFVEEAQIDDLIDLLRTLPEQYPDPNVAVSSGRRTVPGALATLSRWVIGRINNLLSQDSADGRPELTEGIPLVATEGNTLRYVHPSEPVFFADDRYHTARWRDHLPFASLDKNWRNVAEFLGIKPISEHVEENCIPGTMLKAESDRLEYRFKVARPYMLAVVQDQRESEMQDVARYLSNLQVQVVDSLVVHRRLTIPPERLLADDDARIYLEETTGMRVGSAGRAPRTGILFVRKGFEENYDLLAGPIAEFVRIPGLADAFVILLDRGGKSGRMRYLRTRGLDEQDVEEMRDVLAHLGIWDEPEPDVEEEEDLNRHLINQISEMEKDERGGEPEDLEPGSESEEPVVQKDEQPTPTQELEPIEFPPLDLSAVRFIPVGSTEGVLPAEPKDRGRGGGGGGKRDWERDQRLREAYGERGERLVKLWELERLRTLGQDRPEELVRWLREEGNETADHDLESKARMDGKWVDIVIEVKATPARDFRFHMSKHELICALREQERYRLYRVIDVASASPEIYAFENPYTLWEEGKAVIEPRDTYVTLPDPRRKTEREQATGDDR